MGLMREVKLTDDDLRIISDCLIARIGEIAKLSNALFNPDIKAAVNFELVRLQNINKRISNKIEED